MQSLLLLPGGFALTTYVTAIAVGLSVATFVVRRESRRLGLPVRAVFDVALLVLPAGVLFGRLIGALSEPSAWWADPVNRLLYTGGFTFYGSFLGVLVSLWIAAPWRGLDPRRVLDVFCVAMPLGAAFGRLGCLGAGCCHGRPADWPWGVEVPWSVRYYAEGTVPDPLLAVPLHPTPLYDSLGLLALFVGLTWHLRRPSAPGTTFALTLVGYAALRSTTEMFRGDLVRGFVLDGLLSTAQATSVPVLLTGLVLLWAWRPQEA